MLLSDLIHNPTHPKSQCHKYWSTFVDASVSTKSDSAIFANSSANNSVLVRLNP